MSGRNVVRKLRLSPALATSLQILATVSDGICFGKRVLCEASAFTVFFSDDECLTGPETAH